MRPGPRAIVSCPSCNALGYYNTLISGNTLRGTYYTDGKAIFPMFPQAPEVLQCPGCTQPFWRSLAIEVGEFEPSLQHVEYEDGEEPEPVNPEYEKAPLLIEATEPEYLNALDRLMSDMPGDELTLRLLAWHRGNDRYRSNIEPAPEETSHLLALRRQNIDRLLMLLPEADEQDPSKPMMRAELLRQLGEFDQALHLLARPHPKEYAPAVQRLADLCRARDTAVRAL